MDKKQLILIPLLAVICLLGVSYVQAQSWSGPNATPPEGNTPAPLNVESDPQTKVGRLNLGGGLRILDEGLRVDGVIYQYNNENFGLDVQDGVLAPAVYSGKAVLSSISIGSEPSGVNGSYPNTIGGRLYTQGGLIIEKRTTDPTSPEDGRMWLRTDL